MHIFNSHSNYDNIQMPDFLLPDYKLKIYSICGNMDYLYV